MSEWDAFPAVDGGGRGTITIKPYSPQQETRNEWDAFPAVETPKGVGIAEDSLRTVGPALARGVSAIVGLPGDLQKLAGFLNDKLPPSMRLSRDPSMQLPGQEEVIRAVEQNVTGPLYKPQTRVGKFVNSAVEFVPGAVAGPVGAGSRIGNAVRYGAIPGLASEGAGQATEGTFAEPYARAAGAVGAGVLGAVTARPSTASAAIRSQLPEGVTPQMVDQAESLIQSAAQQGVQLSWPEALSQVAGRPVLTNTMRSLEAAPQSEARMAEFFGQRPQQMDNAARSVFDQIAPPTNQPATVGPQVGQAAEQAINDVRGGINRVSEPFYKAADTVRLPPADMRRVQSLPGWREARDAVRNDPQLARYVAGLPDDSVGFLNEVKKYLDQASENAAGAMNQQRNQQRAAGYGLDAGSVRGAAINASPDYATALQIQEQARERFLNPLLQGPLGKLADRDIGTRKAIDALFPSNPLPNSADEIAIAVGAVADRNTWAARQLIRAHAESTFNEAAQALQSGPQQASGAKFSAVIAGNPQQRANLQAAVEALPNGGQLWNGFNRFLDVAEATGTRMNVGSRTAYNQQFLEQAGKSGAVVESVKAATNPLRGLQFVADRYEQWRLGRNLDELARIFTDPQAGNLFRTIAAAPVNSNAARNAAARLGILIQSSGNKSAPQINAPGQQASNEKR